MAIKQRNFWLMLLLSLVTCGIYGIYWFYVFTEDLNRICADKIANDKPSMNYILVFLLSLVTCGIFYLFWLYQQGNRMQEASYAYGRPSKENGTTYLLWYVIGALVCGLGSYYALYLMTANINRLADSYNGEHGFAV